MYRIQLVGKLKGGGQSVDLIFVGLTSYLQITPTTGFTLHGKKDNTVNPAVRELLLKEL